MVTSGIFSFSLYVLTFSPDDMSYAGFEVKRLHWNSLAKPADTGYREAVMF